MTSLADLSLLATDTARFGITLATPAPPRGHCRRSLQLAQSQVCVIRIFDRLGQWGCESFYGLRRRARIKDRRRIVRHLVATVQVHHPGRAGTYWRRRLRVAWFPVAWEVDSVPDLLPRRMLRRRGSMDSALSKRVATAPAQRCKQAIRDDSVTVVGPNVVQQGFVCAQQQFMFHRMLAPLLQASCLRLR